MKNEFDNATDGIKVEDTHNKINVFQIAGKFCEATTGEPPAPSVKHDNTLEL